MQEDCFALFWSFSQIYRQRSLALFLDNLTRYHHGKNMRNVVDKNTGY
ncbi:hypothetical protein [Tolypothrix sp. VBCCA 56010]